MSSDRPTDFAPRSELAKRVKSSDKLGYEPIFEVGNMTVPFHKDFDQFAAIVAHTLRRQTVYRTDNGKIARGLVRYTGDLKAIHLRNLQRQGALQLKTLVLNVTFIRRKSENPKERWVIGIRFQEALVDMEPEDVLPGKDVARHAQKQKSMNFLALALLATIDMGCKGERVRNMLNYAIEIGFPAN